MDYVYESEPTIIEQDRRLLVKILTIGVVLGFVVWGVAYLLWRFVLNGMVCDAGQVTCVSAHNYAGNIALVLAAIIGVVTLVKVGAYRPVIIALGATVSLWGIIGWLYGVGLAVSAIVVVLLYALAYITFAWIARIRKAGGMLAVFIILMIIARVVPMILS